MSVLPARSGWSARQRSPILTETAHDTQPATERRLPGVLLPLDGAAAAVAVVAAMLAPGGVQREGLALLFVPVWILAVSAVGEYSLPGTLAARARRLGLAVIMLPTALLVVADVVDHPLSASTITAVCLASAAIGLLGRVLVVVGAQRGLPVRGVTHRVVLAGTAAGVTTLRGRLESDPRPRFRVVGACEVDAGDATAERVTDQLGLCMDVVRDAHADAVVLAPDPAIAAAEVQRLCWALEDVGVRIFVWTGLSAAPSGRTTLDLTHGLALLHLGAPRRLGVSFAVKQVLDRVIALVALVVLAPLLLGLALLIRLESPGPAFFRQARVGRNNAPFTIWKLRTMTRDAEAALAGLRSANEGFGLLFKMREDPRVTRIGRWLRRSSLDELPQLINVVLGHMSLVGPRPALPSEVDRYTPDVRHRLVMQPGITGLWQVSGRSELPWAEAVRLDQEYVDNWSLALDLRILLLTARAVLRRDGAY